MDTKKSTQTSGKSTQVEGSKAAETQQPQASTQKGSNVIRVINLVVGDALVFLIFALIGRQNHGTGKAVGFLDNFTEIVVIRSSLPDWLVSCCSLFQGVSSRLGTATAQDGAANILAWVIAWPVGLALRGIFIDHGMPPIAFALVTLVFNGVCCSSGAGPCNGA